MANDKQRQKRQEQKRKRREKRQRKAEAPSSTPSTAKGGAKLPKLSVVLSAFAEPLLMLLPEDASASTCKAALQVAMIVWNACLARERDAEDTFSELLPEASAQLASLLGVPVGVVEAEVARLPARRKSLFRHDHRLLAAVEVQDLGDGFHIVALGLDHDALDAARGDAEVAPDGDAGGLRGMLKRLLT